MRTRLAIIAACLCALAGSSARAGQYYLEFGSLLPEQSDTIASYSDQGFTLSSADGFAITGPRAPGYVGMVGLSPLGDTWTLTDANAPIYANTPGAPGPLTIQFGAIAPFESYDVSVVGRLNGAVQWTETLTGKSVGYGRGAGDGYGQLPIGLAAVDTITVTNLDGYNSSPYQILDLSIRTLSVPEPSGALMVCIAIVVGAAAPRRRDTWGRLGLHFDVSSRQSTDEDLFRREGTQRWRACSSRPARNDG